MGRRPFWSLFALLPLALANCNCEDELITRLPVPSLDIHDLDRGSNYRDGLRSIDLGAVPYGQQALANLQLESIGTKDLFVEAIRIEASTDPSCTAGYTEGEFTVPYFEGTLATEMTHDFVLEYKPLDDGQDCADLVVVSSDPAHPEARLLLTADGLAPRLCAAPVPMEFGDAFQGGQVQKELSLTSCGRLALEITNVSLQDGSDDAFSFSDPSSTTGSLAPGEATIQGLRFAPETEGNKSGAVLVETNDPRAPEGVFIIPLRGGGLAAPACRISVLPTEIHFGRVPGGNSLTRRLVISNVGGLDCDVMDIRGPLGSQEFQIIEGLNGLNFPVRLRGTIDEETLNPAPRPETGQIELIVQYESPNRQDVVAANATIEIDFLENELVPDPNNQNVTVSLAANGGGAPICELEVTPENAGGLGRLTRRHGILQFGSVLVGSEKILPIKILNTGSTLCSILGLNFEPQQTPEREFSILGNHEGIFIAPGEEYRIEVAFRPTQLAGTDSGTYQPHRSPPIPGPLGDLLCGQGGAQATALCGNGVTIFTDSPQTFEHEEGPGSFSIGFSATPAEPDIDVVPGRLDFGIETVGCGSVEETVTIYNLGNADLTINGFSIEENSDPEFRITRAPRVPLVVRPGDTAEVRVRMFPRQAGPMEGLLIIENNDGDEQAFTVPLVGEGTLETHHIDRFEQAAEPMVDVLWVVDDSGSMSDEQNALASNFREFIRFATQQINVNFQIAVTTTLADGDMSGVYTACDPPPYLQANTPGLYEHFECNVRVSRNRNPDRNSSDSREAGLEAARNFFRHDRLAEDGLNAGFLREEAKLYIIAVSDEEDQSRGPVGLYEDAFRSIKGWRNRDLINFSAIVGQGGNNCEADRGSRYMELANRLNGLTQDICSNDWRGMMRALGLDTFAFRSSFGLTRRPMVETIEVRVDGNPVARGQEGGNTGWFYDREANAVVFNAGSIPSRGGQIEIEYDTLCAQ